MADYDYIDVEKASLGHIFRSQTKYGTTINTRYRDEVYIEHTVKEDDTLQGIALSHGVTIEDIKRVNQLWSSDCFKLRSTIYIPIPRPSDSATPYLSRDQLKLTSKTKTKARCPSPPELETSADYLSRFDSSLALIKTSVDRLQENSDFHEDYVEPHPRPDNTTDNERVYISPMTNSSSEPWSNHSRHDDIFQL